jgi:hypothetical protein
MTGRSGTKGLDLGFPPLTSIPSYECGRTARPGGVLAPNRAADSKALGTPVQAVPIDPPPISSFPRITPSGLPVCHSR